ncbi:MAG: M81 family metallopeptidase [Betaproteobacteria bacterium]
MKIFIASIATETNTYSAFPTGRAAFEMNRGKDPVATAFRPHLERWAADEGHVLVFGLTTFAQPAGTTVASAWAALRDELLAALRAAMPVDAVVLPLHGAMVAEGCDDCEGELIERVRAIVGPLVPIGVELDLHCHFTERMRRHADILVAYKEYPHTDALDRLAEVWRLTLDTAAGRIRPVTAVADCRMVGLWHTTREPMSGFVRRMQALEGQGGVLSVSFGHGFPFADVPEAGAKVWVVTNDDLPGAQALADELARELFAMRDETRSMPTTVAAALGVLQAAPPGQPLVLADVADNAGGGASNDSTFILAALLERGIGNVAIGPIWDIGAVQICRESGVGSALMLRVGGKCGPTSGQPVDLPVTVRAIREDHTQSLAGLARFDCGPSAWVQTAEGIDQVLISIRHQGYGTDLFTGLGIDLAAKRAIVVKSTQHFHAAFAPLAQEVLYVDTPGLLRSDFEHMDYRRRSLNYWPRVNDPWNGPAGGTATDTKRA